MPLASEPRYLFPHWREIASRIRRARDLALFCDFDGTLVGFRDRPENVALSSVARQAIARLAGNPRIHFWMVSGRRTADLRRRVNVADVGYLGLHGFELDGRPPAHAGVLRNLLPRMMEHFTAKLASLPGVWVEDKEYCFVVHFRNAPPSLAARASRLVRAELKSFGGRFRLQPGRNALEVLPREIRGKGFAVQSLLKKMPSAILPIGLGDDATDESVFAVLRRGITVHVGRSRKTRAHFYLRSPAEVTTFLQRLARDLNGASPAS
jgi:trehalose-phosphatase